MQVETVQSVLRMETGTQIEAFKGRVKKVFTPKTGHGKKGRWSMQGIIVADGTQEIGVTIWEGDELRERDWTNQVIYIEGNIKRDEYEGKAKLNVGEGSNITRAEGAASAPSQERQAPARQHEAPSGDGIGDARAFLGRARNLAILCRRAAVSAGKECDAEDGANFFTAEQLQGLTAMLFIAADKRGLIEAMPTGPMQSAKPAAKPAPAPVEPPAPPPPQEGDQSDIPF